MKPIIVVLERHWDTIPKQVILESLPSLHKAGYSAIGFEVESNVSENKIIDNYKQSVCEETIVTNTIAQELNINAADLTNMSLEEINTAFSALKSSKNPLITHFLSIKETIIVAIKEMNGITYNLKIIQTATQLNMQTIGIDATSEYKTKMNSTENQNLSAKYAYAMQIDKIRVESFVKNAINAQQQGKGIVCVNGQAHYERMVEEFSKIRSLKNVIFIHPYAKKEFMPNDSVLTFNFSKAQYPDLRILEQEINQDSEIQGFAFELIQEVQKSELKPVPDQHTINNNLNFFNKENPIDKYQKAIKFFNNKNFEEAIILLTEALPSFQNDEKTTCHSTLASCYRELGDLEKAKFHCAEGLEICTITNNETLKSKIQSKLTSIEDKIAKDIQNSSFKFAVH